jgi:hypothetical protein
MVIISLLACSVDAKAAEPAEHIDKVLPGSLLGGFALDAVAGRLFVAIRSGRTR